MLLVEIWTRSTRTVGLQSSCWLTTYAQGICWMDSVDIPNFDGDAFTFHPVLISMLACMYCSCKLWLLMLAFISVHCFSQPLYSLTELLVYLTGYIYSLLYTQRQEGERTESEL